MPIEKKHVHLGFYKQVWPSLPLEPLRCGFKRNVIVQNSSWLRACRKSRGKREKPEFGNLGAGRQNGHVKFNPLQESSASSTNQHETLKTNAQQVIFPELVLPYRHVFPNAKHALLAKHPLLSFPKPTQAHWKNVSVLTLLQDYITLVLVCIGPNNFRDALLYLLHTVMLWESFH